MLQHTGDGPVFP